MAVVDIVMPLYNKAETVARAVRSVRNQTVADWRLIVVDDGSTDDGPDIVKNIKDERIEIIRQENRGPGAARNLGIAQANSAYLTFLDADDEWYPWFLENSLQAVRNNKVGFVVSMYYLWPQKTDMTAHWARQGVREGIYLLKGDENPIWVERLKGVLLVLNVLMHTEIARKYDGFYQKDHCVMGEDTTFFLRLLFGESFAIIGPPAVRYHTEAGTLGYYSGAPRSLPPFLSKPETVLKYCPQSKQYLCRKVLDYMAVVWARNMARAGHKAQAQDLLVRFPGTKKYPAKHYRCRYEIALSRWFPAWIRFKCVLSRPIRSFLRSAKGHSDAHQAAPPMPYEKSQPDLNKKNENGQ